MVSEGIRKETEEEKESNLLSNLRMLKIYAKMVKKGDERYWKSYNEFLNSFYDRVNADEEFVKRYLKKLKAKKADI